VPVQCAGARKIRCPHLACGFSEDPGVLGDDNDPHRTARRQFVGTDPARLVPVPLAREGPLLFVHVATVPPPPFESMPLFAGLAAVVPDDLRATAVAEQVLPLGWRIGPRAAAATLASRCGARVLREQQADEVTALIAPTGGEQLRCYLVEPNLLLAVLPGRVLAAMFRPVATDTCSVLSAVLRPAGDPTGGDGDARLWQEVLAAAAGD
jgi:hypothetical protein